MSADQNPEEFHKRVKDNGGRAINERNDRMLTLELSGPMIEMWGCRTEPLINAIIEDSNRVHSLASILEGIAQSGKKISAEQKKIALGLAKALGVEEEDAGKYYIIAQRTAANVTIPTEPLKTASKPTAPKSQKAPSEAIALTAPDDSVITGLDIASLEEAFASEGVEDVDDEAAIENRYTGNRWTTGKAYIPPTRTAATEEKPTDKKDGVDPDFVPTLSDKAAEMFAPTSTSKKNTVSTGALPPRADEITKKNRR